MEAHGEYHIELKSNVIKVKLFGSFNLEGANKYYHKIKKEIEDLNGIPYYLFINALDFEGATPDAYHEADGFSKWMNTFHPPKARIYVLKNKLQLKIALKEEDELNKQNILYFYNETEALDWLDKNNEVKS